MLPNLPCCNSEDLHEEGAIEIVLSNLQHLEEGGSILPLDSYRLPTSDRKRASEEEMHGCFFSLRGTEDTIVIVPFNFEFFFFLVDF